MEVQFTNKKQLKQAAGILLLVSFSCILLAIVTIFSNNTYKKTCATVEATVTKIEITRHAKAYAEYTYNNEKYVSLLPSYNFTLKEGQKYTAYVSPNDPTFIRGYEGSGYLVLFGVAGIFFAVFLFVIFKIMRS